ncbi:Alpha/Beta hydrolase protein [Dichotomocladium elegans]|nr:Alpha/Beta hydrolase protein [Dichotomocladium elegans]
MPSSSSVILSKGQAGVFSPPLHAFLSESQNKHAKALVLLLHGMGGDHHHFDGLIPHLVDAGFDVLVPDLPFHGQSQVTSSVDDSSPHPSLSFSSMMDDLDRLLRVVRPRFRPRSVELIVGGLSMGGMLSQACAVHKQAVWAQLGYRVTGLIPIACPSIHMIYPRIAWLDMYRDAQNTTDDFTQVRQYIISSAVYPEARHETARTLAIVSDATLAQCLRACANALPSADDDNVNPTPRFVTPPPRLPTLLITGGQDDHTLAVMCAWQKLNEADGLTESRLFIKEGASHMVPLDQPAAVARDIVAFFFYVGEGVKGRMTGC